MKAKYFYGVFFTLATFLSAPANELSFEEFLNSLFGDQTQQALEQKQEAAPEPEPKAAPVKAAPAEEAVKIPQVIADLKAIKEKIEKIDTATRSEKYFEKKFRAKFRVIKRQSFEQYDTILGELLSYNVKELYAKLLAKKEESGIRAQIASDLQRLTALERRIDSITHFYDKDITRIRKILEEKTKRKFPTDASVINEILLQQQLPFAKRTIPGAAFQVIRKRKVAQKELQTLYTRMLPNTTKKLEAFMKKSKPEVEKIRAEQEKQIAAAAKAPSAGPGPISSTIRDSSGRRWPSYNRDSYRRGYRGYQPGRYRRDETFRPERDEEEPEALSDDDSKGKSFVPGKKKKEEEKKETKTSKAESKRRQNLLKKYIKELEKLDKEGVYDPKKILWQIDPKLLDQTKSLLTNLTKLVLPRTKQLREMLTKIATFVDAKSSPTLQKEFYSQARRTTLTEEFKRVSGDPQFKQIDALSVVRGGPFPEGGPEAFKRKIDENRSGVQYHLFKKNQATINEIKKMLTRLKISPPEQKDKVVIIEAITGMFLPNPMTQRIEWDTRMIPDSRTGIWQNFVKEALKKAGQRFLPLDTGYFANETVAPEGQARQPGSPQNMRLFIKYKIGNTTHMQEFNIADRVILDPARPLFQAGESGYETEEE